MEQQETMIKFQMIQQEAAQLQEKMQIMDENIAEMHAIKASLDNLEANKEGVMLSNLGKGIFIKTKIVDRDLYVNTGKEVVVKKTIPETKQILDEQIQKLSLGKGEVMQHLEKLQIETQKLIQEAQQAQVNAQEEANAKEKPAAKVKKN